MGAMMMTADSGPALGPQAAAPRRRAPIVRLMPALLLVHTLSAAARLQDPDSFALFSPQQAALNGAGTAWAESQDPALWSRTRSPSLQWGVSQSYEDVRGGGVQARLPWGARAGWGLGVGLERHGRRSEQRLRAGLGWDFNRGRWPSLGAALNLRDRRGGRDDGLASAADLGMAWSLSPLGLDLGLSLRELPLGGPFGSWRRQGALGLAWRGPAQRWALDLTQQGDLDLVGHAALDLDLKPGWSALASFASPQLVGAPWVWALGLQHHRGDWTWSLSSQQAIGGGSGTVHAGAHWSFRPEVELPQRRRAPAPKPQPTPTTAAPSFQAQARLQGAAVHLSWSEQPNAQAYEVLVGLVQGASMRLAAEGRVELPRWRGELGLPGAVYYFKVRALNADDAPVGESQVLVLQAPGGQP